MVLQKTETSRKGYKSAKGKTVYAHIGIWKKGEQIHITIPKEDWFHTTVNNNEGSERCHKNLYGKLKRLLEQYGCWE
jgi:hypothetical protein